MWEELVPDLSYPLWGNGCIASLLVLFCRR